MSLPSDQLEGFKQRINEMQDDDLVKLLALHQSDYRPEFLQLARDAIKMRGLEEIDADEYIRRFPHAGPEFCDRCKADTIDESCGDIYAFNGIGTSLGRQRDPCSVCGSFIMDKYIKFFVPVARLGRYRVKFLTGSSVFAVVYSSSEASFIARKLRKR